MGEDTLDTLQKIVNELRENLNVTLVKLKAMNSVEGNTEYTQVKRLEMDTEQLLESAAVRTDTEEFADLYGSDDYYSSSLDC